MSKDIGIQLYVGVNIVSSRWFMVISSCGTGMSESKNQHNSEMCFTSDLRSAHE